MYILYIYTIQYIQSATVHILKRLFLEIFRLVDTFSSQNRDKVRLFKF